jgi:hypothetical protein
MGLSASQAAAAVGMTRQGIIKAIKTGRISAEKDQNGAWTIEPVELHRVYAPVNQNAATAAQPVESGLQGNLQAAEREIAVLRETVDDLRRRLDQEGDERRRLTMLLTDQRVEATRSSIWKRIFSR